MGIIGSCEGYVTSPLYLYNRGTWSNVQTTGFSATTPKTEVEMRDDCIRMRCSASAPPYSGTMRLNHSINITNYNYINVRYTGFNSSSGGLTLGVSTSSNETTSFTSSVYTGSTTGGVMILNISSLYGNYFIYFRASMATSGSAIYQLYLSN